MKKLGVLLVFILLLSLVVAANNSLGVKNQVGNANPGSVKGGGNGTGNGNGTSSNQGLGQTIRNRVRAGVYTSESGKRVRVSEMAKNKIRLKVNNVSAECGCNLTREENKSQFKMKLSNGRNARIKIMPDKASERALEKLRLKNCNKENNCSIELKEVGKKNKTAAYEIQLRRQAKVLGLFKKKMQVKSQISAENGEVLQVKKPWWAFLASEPEE